MNKQKELDEIAHEIETCEICKVGKSGKAVPGEGNPDADVAFIGEAPGKQEAMSGRPFIGRSGQFLRSLIREIGLREEDVYITSPVKYLPDRGTPTKSDIEHGRVHFQKQLDVIQPKVIVLLGRVAAEGVLGRFIPVMQKHGQIIEESGRKYFLTIHPAAAIRFQKNRAIIKDDFQKLSKYLSSIK